VLEGYVLDVPYVRLFVGDLAPPTLRLVAALNGLPAPAESDFDYCELGSGNGDTIVTLAAANPGARFVGVDFNDEHLRFASELASRGGVANVRFLPTDFDDLAGADIPPLDFLVMHGVWSWVSAAKRRSILAFAKARLKPGGLLCTSYNALPGWAALEPLRRLVRSGAESATGSTLDRARAGMAFVERLAAANAGYFASHPTAKSMVELMQKEGPNYVAHEYFGSEWHPMYFADVAAAMSEHGLGYVGQVPLHLNVPALSVPPVLVDVARTTKDRVALETLKDFAANQLFRTDVFAPGKVTRSRQEQAFFFEATPFGIPTSADRVRRTVDLGSYTLDYRGPDYDAILAAVAQRPSTAMELAMRPELVAIGQARIGACLQNLVLGEQVVPMRPTAGTGPGLDAGQKVAAAFNEQALDQALTKDGPLVLASTAMGTGLRISLVEALALREGKVPSGLETLVNPGGRAG
jgi:SAM-dependent methyltransferase